MLRHDLLILIFHLDPHPRLIKTSVVLSLHLSVPGLHIGTQLLAALFSGTQSQRYLKSHARTRPFF
jgi:hypothetical protein